MDDPIYETYQTKNFKQETLDLIALADSIINEYAAEGYTLSLRQLYYQFVSQGFIENSDRSYKNLGSAVTDGRMAGLIPWNGIEDRGRNLETYLIEEDVTAILRNVPKRYAADLWSTQPYYVEVWVEKDALSSVVGRACDGYRVPYMACKGYLSASEAWRAGKRFEQALLRGKEPLIIHLGDHDPSGIDMTRDNQDRVSMFAGDMLVPVRRIALNRDQIDRYNPPPNPAKITDSRAHDYIARHGTTSWELDALPPRVLVDLIERTIRPLIDPQEWNDKLDLEKEQKGLLDKLAPRWPEIKTMLWDEEPDDDQA